MSSASTEVARRGRRRRTRPPREGADGTSSLASSGHIDEIEAAEGHDPTIERWSRDAVVDRGQPDPSDGRIASGAQHVLGEGVHPDARGRQGRRQPLHLQPSSNSCSSSVPESRRAFHARDTRTLRHSAPPYAAPVMPELEIAPDDPRSADVVALLQRHLTFANDHSPPEDVHTLDLDGLRDPAVAFFSARREGELLAIGALKRLDDTQVELKSMHTAESARGQGVGRAMVEHLLRTRARRRLPAGEPRDRFDGRLRASASAVRERRVHAVRPVRRVFAEPERHVHDLAALTNSLTSPKWWRGQPFR